MDDFSQLSVDRLLDEVAGRTPTPGGGCVTGIAGALACALARMVTAYALKPATAPSTAARLGSFAAAFGRADELLRALAYQDAAAYEKLTKAAQDREKGKSPTAEAVLAEAVLAATGVPMEMAAVLSRMLHALDDLKELAGRYLLSDLGIAAVLAEAAAKSAEYTVKINAGRIADQTIRTKVLADIRMIINRCGVHQRSIEDFVRLRLENASPSGR